MGHSLGGGELTAIGAQHPDRIAGLVYLDAVADPTDDYTELNSRIQQLPPAIRNLPQWNGGWLSLHLPVTLQEFAEYHRAAHGFAFPIGEVLADY